MYSEAMLTLLQTAIASVRCDSRSFHKNIDLLSGVYDKAR
jgi:hypothetical protein